MCDKNLYCGACGTIIRDRLHSKGDVYFCDAECKENFGEGNFGVCYVCDAPLAGVTGYNSGSKVFCDAACMGEYIDNRNEGWKMDGGWDY